MILMEIRIMWKKFEVETWNDMEGTGDETKNNCFTLRSTIR